MPGEAGGVCLELGRQGAPDWTVDRPAHPALHSGGASWLSWALLERNS